MFSWYILQAYRNYKSLKVLCTRLLYWHIQYQIIFYNIYAVTTPFGLCVCVCVCVCSRYRPGCGPEVGWRYSTTLHDHGTRRGWVVSSTPRPHFTPREDLVPIVQEAGCTGGWVDPRAGMDGQKISPYRDSIPGPSSYTDWATRPTYVYMLQKLI
jgi:hypothetical protein